MQTKKKLKISAAVRSRARQVLALAGEKAEAVSDWLELSNALFAVDGIATRLFPTEPERAAFLRTPEYRRILQMYDRLPTPPPRGVVEFNSASNGSITVRVPQSVRSALLAEAKAEGVSLDELCLSKLVARLRKDM
jgi:hypothetical protein